MKRLDFELFDEVALRAVESPRKRMHYDLRDSEDEQTMRMLNVLMRDTVIPVHRHTDTSEIVAVVRGRVQEVTYDVVDGQLVERECVELVYGSDCPCVQVPVGAWHTCRCLEDGSVILEVKTGRYDRERSEEVFTPSAR